MPRMQSLPPRLPGSAVMIGCCDSLTVKLRADYCSKSSLAGESLPDPAVDRDDAAGRLGRAVAGQEERGLGDVVGADRDAEEGALSIVLLELVDRDAVGAGALGADGLRPEPALAEDRVRVEHVGAHAVRSALDREDAAELGLGGLGGAVCGHVPPGRERALGHDEDDVAADALAPEEAQGRAGGQ